MPPQSHEEMIKEFAKLAGSLGGPNAKANKWKQLGRKSAVQAIKLAVGLSFILALSVVGWVFLTTLHEIGLISWSVTLWQGIKLIAPPLLLLIATPITLNVRMRS